MCTCARPYGRAGRCGFGGRGVTNGIRADPRGCAYGSVCGSEDESVSRVICVRVLAPTEGLGGASLVGEVLQSFYIQSHLKFKF
jgi:hypothetical protein